MAEDKKKQYTIAIMTGDTQSDYSEEIMRGFYTAAREENVTLVLLMGPQIPTYCTDIVTSSLTVITDISLIPFISMPILLNRMPQLSVTVLRPLLIRSRINRLFWGSFRIFLIW